MMGQCKNNEAYLVCISPEPEYREMSKVDYRRGVAIDASGDVHTTRWS